MLRGGIPFRPWFYVAPRGAPGLLAVPFLQPAFSTTSLDLADWLLIVAVSSSALIVVEVSKWLASRLGQRR